MRGAHLLSVDNAAAVRWAAAVELLQMLRWCTMTFAMVISFVAVNKRFGQR